MRATISTSSPGAGTQRSTDCAPTSRTELLVVWQRVQMRPKFDRGAVHTVAIPWASRAHRRPLGRDEGMHMNGKARQRAVLTSWLAVIGLAAAAFLVVRGPAMPAASGTTASAVPAPTLDEPATGRPKAETAVLAGGCFWGVQGVYQHVKGVQSAQSGYAGGDAATA